MARGDIVQFLDDHEQDLREIFREELEKLDERMPEEEIFINVRMVALGDELMQAVLVAIKRFLSED
jgi:hypothetical protein